MVFRLMALLLSFLLTAQLIECRGNELLNRFNTVPLDILEYLFGTAENTSGGAEWPLDSRLFGLLTLNHPYYFTQRPEPPPIRDSSTCVNLYNSNPRWAKRYKALVADHEATTTPNDFLEQNMSTASTSGELEEWISLIDYPEQLAKMDEFTLECLLGIGYVPPRIPLGQVYGRVNGGVMGNHIIGDIAQAMWGGKIIIKTTCDDGSNLYVSCNQVGYGTGAYAHVTLGSHPDDKQLKVYGDEVIDEGDWMWINYTQNFTRVCEPQIPRHYMSSRDKTFWERGGGALGRLNETRQYIPTPRSALPSGGFVGGLVNMFVDQLNSWGRTWTTLAQQFLSGRRWIGAPGVGITAPARLTAGIFDNAWPVRLVVDQGRWIGRDQDEGLDIYLYKSMLLFPEGLRPVLFFNLKSADLMEVNIIQ